MDELNQEIEQVISSVINGSSSSSEKTLFDNWILSDPKNIKLFTYLSHIQVLSNENRGLSSKEIVYAKMQFKITEKRNKRILHIWQFVAAASVIFLVIMGTTLFINRQYGTMISNVTTETPKGLKTKIILSDGTIAYLNSGSSLNYPSTFSGEQRKVLLKGEAYFEVAKDKMHPFIVKTQGLNIKVLGTHFNITSYNEDNKIVTTLLEGSVSICMDRNLGIEKPIILIPNQQAVFDKNIGKFQVQQVDASLYALWKENQLFFEKESFANISKKLERIYNVTIQLTGEQLKLEVFSGQFNKSENILKILNIMKEHRNFDYRIIQDTIWVYKCKNK